MNQIETEATVSADALIAVVEQLVRDTAQNRAIHVALDSSLERELGLDSLARVELVFRVERAFNVSLPESALYAAETPRDFQAETFGAANDNCVLHGKSFRAASHVSTSPTSLQR